MRGRLKVVFLPEYNVTLAERCIPAAEVSNQISTAGYEASGTSNMKFMMNGALTIGTRDGATIEMAEEAGEENFFLFGLTAQEVAKSQAWYSPYWHYENEPETRTALDLIFSDHFSRNEPGIFEPLRGALLTHGDRFMHLADLTSYLQADGKLCELYRKPDEWTQKVMLNIAASGKFSSDRTIGNMRGRSGARSPVRWHNRVLVEARAGSVARPPMSSSVWRERGARAHVFGSRARPLLVRVAAVADMPAVRAASARVGRASLRLGHLHGMSLSVGLSRGGER